jgi:hypothetical protein
MAHVEVLVAPRRFAFVDGQARYVVPVRDEILLSYFQLRELGWEDRIEEIAAAFWALAGEYGVKKIEIAYRAGDPHEIYPLRP